MLTFLRAWLTIIVVIIGGVWTLTTFWVARSDAERQREITQRLEAQKPFLTEKTKLFLEAAQVAGKLAAYSPDSRHEEWKKAELRFWALRWSELEMAGNPAIRNAMRRVQRRIVELKEDPTNVQRQHDLRWMVECLADELRLSWEVSWGNVRAEDQKGGPNLDQLGRKTYSELRDEIPNGCYAGSAAPSD